MVQIKVNGTDRTVDAPDAMPLLWALRDELKLTGTKFGCGVGACGACTVHVNGRATKSCVTPLGSCTNKEIGTIEGLSTAQGLHAVQAAWLEERVSQCGYCQPGQIMAAVALITAANAQNRTLTDADIDEAMSENLCRCGTYPRIRQAVKRAATNMRNGG